MTKPAGARAPGCIIIGPGRVGQSLATVAATAGYRIEAMIKRTPTHKEPFTPPKLLLITTPDDTIEPVARRLAARSDDWRGTVALHCSGAFGAELLEPLRARGCQVGSLHPLKSFAAPVRDIAMLGGIYWCVEGEGAAERVARRLARAARGRVVRVDARWKAVYHAAAVMACGHLVALVDISLAMLAECGIARARALDMLAPLIEGTVSNVMAKGTRAALTGPFARGDERTIRRHIAALTKLDKDYAAIYKLLGRHSSEMKKN